MTCQMLACCLQEGVEWNMPIIASVYCYECANLKHTACCTMQQAVIAGQLQLRPVQPTGKLRQGNLHPWNGKASPANNPLLHYAVQLGPVTCTGMPAHNHQSDGEQSSLPKSLHTPARHYKCPGKRDTTASTWSAAARKWARWRLGAVGQGPN